MDIWRRASQRTWAAAFLVCLRNHKETSVAGAEGRRGWVVGNRVGGNLLPQSQIVLGLAYQYENFPPYRVQDEMLDNWVRAGFMWPVEVHRAPCLLRSTSSFNMLQLLSFNLLFVFCKLSPLRQWKMYQRLGASAHRWSCHLPPCLPSTDSLLPIHLPLVL